MDRDFDDTTDKVVLAVDDASIGSQLDPLSPLFLRDIPPLVGLIRSDVRQIVVQLAAYGATERHTFLTRPI
jgi:hypothetical protein